MKINPYIQQASQAAISLGFGILTVERFLKVADLAKDIFHCHESQNRCQMPIFESLHTMATMVAAGYISFKYGQAIMPVRPIPTPKPLQLSSPAATFQELVAFHPGAKALSEEKAGKIYILDSFDESLNQSTDRIGLQDKKEL